MAVITAKSHKHSIGAGTQQSPDHADQLVLPFVSNSNGDGFIFNDEAAEGHEEIESELALEAFPTPNTHWKKYKRWKIVTNELEEIILQDYSLGACRIFAQENLI